MCMSIGEGLPPHADVNVALDMDSARRTDAAPGGEPTRAMATPCVYISTDGSVGGTPIQAGWGFVVVEGGERVPARQGMPDASIKLACGPVVVGAGLAGALGAEQHTNNTGELSAIVEALLYVRLELAPGVPVVIRFDSQYAVDVCEGSRGGEAR